MTVKIISKCVKIISLIVFPMCFIVKNIFILVDFFSDKISFVLIIPKSSRRAALKIVNAPETFCAGRGAALRRFVFSPLLKKAIKGRDVMPARIEQRKGRSSRCAPCVIVS
ncbi:MAG: hypothetical protein ACI3X6_08255 [Alloprevotella sp.]